MRKNKMKTTSVITAILMIATITVSAYNGNGSNNNSNKQHLSCTSKIEGLTQQQVEAINNLEQDHQKKMDVLRTERRSTTNEKRKAEIRIKMIETRDSHRAEVKKLLTSEQQKAFDAQHYNGNNHKYAQKGNRIGSKNNGCGNGACRR